MHRLALLVALTGCVPPQPRAGAGSTVVAPAKCSACHMAPQRGSLRVERWPRYLDTHERLRLSDADKAFLRDFLVRPP